MPECPHCAQDQAAAALQRAHAERDAMRAVLAALVAPPTFPAPGERKILIVSEAALTAAVALLAVPETNE